MTRTVMDLDFGRQSEAVLLRDDDGAQALWVTRDENNRYTLNDANSGVPLGADEDIDAVEADWRRAVEWDEERDDDTD